jgi:Zn finger protein HypA/HybF involved in hydrogenase expression
VGEAPFKESVSYEDDRVKKPPEEASRYCPVCSQPLASRSCKLICPGCGYYMSCSDFY